MAVRRVFPRHTIWVVALAVVVMIPVGIALVLFNSRTHTEGQTQDTRGTLGADSAGSSEDLSSPMWNRADLSSEFGELVHVLSPFERLIALDNLMHDATIERLKDLLDQVENIHPKYLQIELREGVIRKLAMLDPLEALTQIEDIHSDDRNLLTTAIFEEWSASNPIEAAKFIDNLNGSQQRSAAEGMLGSGVEIAPAIQRDLEQTVNMDQFALDQRVTALLDESFDDPEDRWLSLQAILGSEAFPQSNAQREALVDVAIDWLELDRLSATGAVLESFERRTDRALFVEEILKGLVASDFQDLRTFAASIESEDRVMLSQAIEGWAASEGEKAFDAAQLIDSESAIDPRRMQRRAIASWAENNPHSLIESLPKIPEDLQIWSQQTALMAMAKTSPESIPALMMDLEDDLAREIVASNVIADWARLDPYAAFEWVNDPKISSLPGVSSREVFHAIARENPHAAIEIALTFPMIEGGIGREADIISATASLDVEMAIDMLPSARNKATRRSAYNGIGMALIMQGDSDRAIELVKDEPQKVQTEYFSNFITMWAHYWPRDMLEKIDALPNDEARKMCSSYLLRLNEQNLSLNKKDMEKLGQYVEESERHLLLHTTD
ncbi:MAG: hypothetical protein F4X44_10060 [Gammaproteobacteria bacterium]|nr:hypothetical protein [Gammaproteobacteria bacterium]